MRSQVLLFCWFTGVVLAAQQPPAPGVIRVTVQEVVAPVTVTDKDGNHVAGLEGKDFTVLDNGKEQQIKVDVSFVPISLVLCVQANHVVEEVLPKIKTIGPLLESLVVGEQGEVAVIAFDHRIRVMQDFTSEGGLIKQALEKIQPGSTTSRLIDTVFQAARMLRNRPRERRKVMLIISETQDRGSEGRLREALLEVQMPNIQVFTVNINRAFTTLTAKPLPPRPDHVPPAARPMPGGAPQTPGSVAQLGGLGGNSANFVPMFVEIFKQVKAIFVSNSAEVLTQYTGGREYSFVTQANLQSAVSRIGEELHSQYLISYNPNNNPTIRNEGGWHDIKVIVHRAGLNVRTRQGYWMAGPSE